MRPTADIRKSRYFRFLTGVTERRPLVDQVIVYGDKVNLFVFDLEAQYAECVRNTL
jgi:hypothetical protein